MPIVSVSMPAELVERLDQFAEDHGYSGRSEVIRDAGRALLEEFDDPSLEGRRLMATVTVLFDYQTGTVEAEMMEIRHEFDDVVESNFHTHVGGDFCLELFVLDGSLEAISTVVATIRATDDVQTVSYSVLPMDDDTVDAE